MFCWNCSVGPAPWRSCLKKHMRRPSTFDLPSPHHHEIKNHFTKKMKEIWGCNDGGENSIWEFKIQTTSKPVHQYLVGAHRRPGATRKEERVWESCLSAYVTPFKKQLKLNILQKCLLSIAVTKPLYCAYRPTELAIQVFPAIYRERQSVRGDRWCAGGDKI